jgi:FKBP-type peptidyl-prolyl cis-trans isomerase FkpA
MRVSLRSTAWMASALSGTLLFAGATNTEKPAGPGAVTPAAAEKSSEFATEIDQASYAVGRQISESVNGQGIKLNADILAASIKGGLSGEANKLTPDQMQASMTYLQGEMHKGMAAIAEKNKAASAKALADNKVLPGVKTTESGLQYKELVAGKGKSPDGDAEVKVRYRGTRLDDTGKFTTEFDSTEKREPAVFPVTGVIPGWTEALKMMKPGAKWELTVPSDLAYGPQGRPGIPPNSVLRFEVELVEVMKAEKKPTVIDAAKK